MQLFQSKGNAKGEGEIVWNSWEGSAGSHSNNALDSP